jgi:DNA-binding response OmpR family regulator
VIAAVYPEACSETVTEGVAFSASATVYLEDLIPEDLSLREADVLVVELGPQPMRRLRETSRIVETLGMPVLVVLDGDHLALVEAFSEFSDFLVAPVNPVEMRLRLHRLVQEEASDAVLRFKDLELNPLNYQATLAGEPMDMTYMEYELLRFLVGNPVRVWSREQLLSKVWGYEYYGGARTVDVHVRRLRSKLGEERSSWITTVRSVGYRFG